MMKNELFHSQILLLHMDLHQQEGIGQDLEHSADGNEYHRMEGSFLKYSDVHESREDGYLGRKV
jgi:hypothetical protein